ncbi:MAG TPA: hypothetical protein VGQ23_12735 [Burkholderiaceae bacterium]|jgi:hypothetical protein|nr:hypothetical protein [Burkholderiaceae bacterium]
MRFRRAVAAALLGFGVLTPVWPAQGGVVLETEAQAPWRSFLVRRTNGAADPRFGSDGRVQIDAISPRSVVADDRGRFLVAGQTRGAEQRLAVQRYLSNGQLDATWLAPLGDHATAVEAMPLGDGRTLVVGEIERLNRQASLWIADIDGGFEPRWLLQNEATSSRVLSLVRTEPDTVMLGLKAGRDAGVTLEVYFFTVARNGDALPERIAKQPIPAGWGCATLQLERREQGWFWVAADLPKRPSVRVAGSDEADVPLWAWQQGTSTAAQVAGPSASSPLPEAGGAVYSPFVERSAELSAKPAAARDSDRTDWTLLVLATLAAGYAVIGLVRRSAS